MTLPTHSRTSPLTRDWLASLVAEPDAGAKGGWVARFESLLQRAFPVASVQLGPASRLEPAGQGSEPRAGLAFDFAVKSTSSPHTLRIRLHAGRSADPQLVADMRTAASVATLVLEADRRHLRNGGVLRALDRSSRRLVGNSAPLLALQQRIARVARTDFTVLLEGESGSGKELVARQVHRESPRSHGPFVAVNCAAIVETLLEAELFGIEDRTATGVRGRRGKFEMADTGTLFLDEVSDLSLAAQAKLLRAIQDLAVERVGGHGTRHVDVRIIAATNRSLKALVDGGTFRADLYHRLNGIEIVVPPLRARLEDIPALAEHFLDQLRLPQRYTLSVEARDALIAYRWPGNVRELERVLERAVTLADSGDIRLDDLPAHIAEPYSRVLIPSLERADSLRAWASRYVRLVLARHHNNKRQACRSLGISYHTLQSHLRQGPRLVRRAKGHSVTENAARLGAVGEDGV